MLIVLLSEHEDRIVSSEGKKHCMHERYAKRLRLCQCTQPAFMSTSCVLGALLGTGDPAVNSSSVELTF